MDVEEGMMAIDWQARWGALNERQQAYLQIIYGLDYENELTYRVRWNVKRKGYPPPASEWRWLAYDGGPGGFMDTPLRRRLGEQKLVDPGTGATFEALEERGLIERKYEWLDDAYGVLQVQMTRAGRALVRKNVDVPRAERPARPKQSEEAAPVAPPVVVEIEGVSYDLRKLGAAIGEKRGGRGLKETSNEIGMSPSMLSRVEQAKQAAPEIYELILKWLGCSWDEFAVG